MIRRITNDDIDDIIKLENDTINTTLGRELFELAVRSEMAYYYVYLENNKIVGYISSSFDGSTVEILNFCVYKEYQNKGIGTKLICHLLDECYKKGALYSVLDVRESNDKARKLYSRLGYKDIHVRKAYYSNGDNAILMQKAFTPYQDLYQSYMENFCVIERNKDYISYRDDNYKIKYDYNKYEITNEENLDKVMKKIKKDNNRNFLELETSFRHNEDFPNMVESNCIILHSNIANIKLEAKYSDVRLYEKCYRDDYLKFNYDEDLRYDTAYAEVNGKFKADQCENKPKSFRSFLVYDNNKLIGIVDTYQFMDTAYIENFVILEDYRKKGYGTSLFKGMLDKLEECGVHDVYLDADNDDTPKFMYKKWGFVEVGSYYSYHEDY